MSRFSKSKLKEAEDPFPTTWSNPRKTPGFLARTDYPTSAEVPVQMHIKWNTEDKDLGSYGSTDSLDDLVATIKAKHPHLSLAAIRKRLQLIEENRSWFSMSDIRISFNEYAKTVPVPLLPAEKGSGVSLPSNKNERLDFGFTTRTRLRATINGVAVGETTNDDDHHAEENILPAIERYIETNGIDPRRSSLIITINNSPCLDRCTPQLVDAQRRWKFGEFRINYANPYGDLEEFRESASQMGARGIVLKPFEPRSFLSSRDELSEDQSERMETMARRRNTISLPDPANSRGRSRGFSTPNADARSSRDRSRGKAKESRDRSASPAPDRSKTQSDRRGKASASSILHDRDAYRELIEDGDEHDIRGRRMRVVHAPDDGNCFYESLAYHLGGDHTASSLRDQARELLEAQGDDDAADRAGTDGEYAEQEEMEALANHLGVTLIVYQYVNSWRERPQVGRIGRGRTTYHFIQSLGHIRPLDLLDSL